MTLTENIYLLESLILSGKPPSIIPYEEGLPLWLKRAAKYYKLKHNKISIGLIDPQTPLEFDVLQKIHKQIEKKEPMQWLISADKINPRYRALFVKNNVPFIFKDQSIFAPLLGLKMNRKQVRNASHANTTIVSNLILALELKLLAGVLTNQLTIEDFNLEDLQSFLEKRNFNISKMTLSRTINQLIKKELVMSRGAGPNRLLNFKSQKDIWTSIRNTPIKTGVKLFETKYQILKKGKIYSGESALQHYSDLAEPDKKTLLLHKKTMTF